jgi:hypothetical protein
VEGGILFMMTSTHRVRRFRELKRAGIIKVTIPINEIELVDKLIESRLLSPTKADSREAVTKATTQLVEIFSKEKT